ncbi:MAG: TRAP transporter small permease subunit [Pseudomonadota bacterium]|jgi:TRAP-type mannitol/chloroaromatic compound transport system permease small subunit|uniref:Tripartite ATP-independent transporter, DctQ component n=1 Tax=Thalassococcus halodurans TaxID=373675 RepID=A0A1H5X2U8_9RHOB|nr:MULTISPECIES: TRAP transporter small permease subunit [Thalassococcus]MBO6866872.1 TRAP transporter small permease subunit [Thalassococcus sp.]MEC7668246.1 TRAP transporter small permease subunit [Pseudomonadota bacterium]MEC8579963.1 TRAP transporter small permease subunit [Pseudomonadota bacterium]SEG06078.1 Tripartite ATP-independent transporter, DctQ component [Thalassococcus halodurans]
MEEEAVGLGGMFGAIGEGIVLLFQNIAMAFYNFGYAITHPSLWLDWSDKQAIMRFVYYGGSVEFFFVVFTAFLVLTAIGLWRNSVMWGTVRVLEGLGNTLGRFFAWAGLLMVLQQVVIVFMQRIFTRPDISFGFGVPLQFDISWWAEELKLYNALVVTLCLTYTFVQRGHVRVDLVYSAVSYRTKRVIDMFGSLFFMMPIAVLIWMYSWYFMWRHLIVPKPSASDALDRLLTKSRALRWNVETIGFSPNGFTAYFLFKILLVVMCGLIFLQAIAFFYRSYLEWKEGEESEDKYLDVDVLEDVTDEQHAHGA